VPGQVSWFWNIELLTDGTDGTFLYFAMPGKWSDFPVEVILPDGMVATLSREKATVGAKMTFQFPPFHEAAS